MLPEDPFYGESLSLTTEQQINPFDEDREEQKRLFFIRNKKWRKGSFIEKRLIVHKLIEKILAEGWTKTKFNQEDLLTDLLKLVNMNLKRHIWNKDVIIYLGLSPGRRLMEQFTDWNGRSYKNTLSLKEGWEEPDILLWAINRILYGWQKNVQKHTLLWAMTRNPYIGVKFIPPSAYRTIFRCFGLSGKVIADPYPDPSKAIAASLEEMTYHGSTHDELAKFLGTEFHPLNRSSYDCAFLDYGFVYNERYIDDLWDWRASADSVVLFVPYEMAGQAPKPNRYLKVITEPFGQRNYLFFYE